MKLAKTSMTYRQMKSTRTRSVEATLDVHRDVDGNSFTRHSLQEKKRSGETPIISNDI